MLRVLTKPELDGAIVMPEFLQIMENLGLYDEEEGGQSHQQDDDGDSDDQKAEQEEQEGNSEEPAKQKKKKGGAQLDLAKLDQKSVKIMVMLMVNLLQAEISTAEFFEEVIFEQNVKSKNRNFTMHFLKADDFFRVL